MIRTIFISILAIILLGVSFGLGSLMTNQLSRPIIETVVNSSNSVALASLSFNVARAESQTRLSINVPEGQSACIWTETSSDYATGANIFTTESIQNNGNSHVYEKTFTGVVSAICKDKYGGEYHVKSVSL